MTNFIDGIGFDLHTNIDLENKELANKAISMMLKGPKFIRPKKFGHLDPIDHRIDSNNINQIVDVWMGKEYKNVKGETYKEGLLIMEFCREGDFMIDWTKGDKSPFVSPKFNSISGGIPTKYVSKNESRLPEYLDFIKQLLADFNPVFGIIQNMMTPGWDVVYDLNIRLPDIPWGSIFGKPYIGLFGYENLLNAPFFNIEELPSGHIFAQLTESILDPRLPKNKRDELRKYLGRECFMEGKKSYRHYNDSNAPNFNLF